jgi:hypothetical protein
MKGSETGQYPAVWERKVREHMKNTTLRAIFAAVMVLGATTQAAVLGPDGHYYDIVVAPTVNWSSAYTAASGMTYNGAQGYLATITSATEDSFLNALIASVAPPTGAQLPPEFWAGGYQNPLNNPVATDGWKWVNGEGAIGANGGYQHWNSGEPNDAYGPGSEQFLALGLWGPNGGWNDEGNLGNIGGFLVEYGRVAAPEGAAGLAGILTIAGLFLAHRRARKA